MIRDDDIREIFKQYHVIAVYGMSHNAQKAAHYVPAFLLRQGYVIIPIYPMAGVILDLRCYKRLVEVPAHIDILAVFRPSTEVITITEEAVDRKKTHGDIRVIWLQDGIFNEQARKIAESAGIVFIQDRCMMKEYKRLCPEGIVSRR